MAPAGLASEARCLGKANNAGNPAHNPTQAMSLTVNFDTQFARDAYRIGPDIYKKTLTGSPWLTLLPNKPWPDGISDNIQVLTVQRTLPDNIDDWATIALSDGTTNACTPTSDEVPYAYDLLNYNLTEKALHSIPLCVTDNRNGFQVKKQAAIMYENLTHVVKYVWSRRKRNEYERICKNKVVAAPELPQGETHFPATPATYQLSGKMLNNFRHRLLADNADVDGGSFAMVNGAPQFVLITDEFTSDNLMTENKEAFLWNPQRVPELLQPLGVERAFRGFYHVIDRLPKHFDFVGGAWVEIPPYDAKAATAGTKQTVSTAYLRAPFTMSYVFVPTVYQPLVPNSIASIGNATFDPVSYMGEFVWRNIPTHDTNPFGMWGMYHALMQMGSEPIHPEFGYAVIHMRCPHDIGGQGCASYDAVTSSESAAVSDSSMWFGA